MYLYFGALQQCKVIAIQPFSTRQAALYQVCSWTRIPLSGHSQSHARDTAGYILGYTWVAIFYLRLLILRSEYAYIPNSSLIHKAERCNMTKLGEPINNNRSSIISRVCLGKTHHKVYSGFFPTITQQLLRMKWLQKTLVTCLSLRESQQFRINLAIWLNMLTQQQLWDRIVLLLKMLIWPKTS